MAGLKSDNYHALGVDEDGDEHILWGGNPEHHVASHLCGCNPDPYNDDSPYDWDRQRSVRWWWSHHA